VRFATLDGVDALVTDSDIEPADRRALEQAGIEVVVA
jgi:DeoR family fructose operon transcriptional repressor